jgi:ribosomal protein L40E
VPKTLISENQYVEASLAGLVICKQCGATLDTYADKCHAPLEAPCEGFLRVERELQDYKKLGEVQ